MADLTAEQANAGSSPDVGFDHPDTDLVAAAVARVRADLAARRERGELPTFPPDELRRQFDAVVEAYEGALLELPPVEFDSIRDVRVITGIAPTQSRVPGGSALHQTIGKIVGRQTSALAQQMREFGNQLVNRIEDVADRQDRMRRFLLVAHLDRVRTLEYRVAQLELELDRLRGAANGEPTPDAG